MSCAVDGRTAYAHTLFWMVPHRLAIDALILNKLSVERLGLGLGLGLEVGLFKVMFSEQLEKTELEVQQTICEVSLDGGSKQRVTLSYDRDSKHIWLVAKVTNVPALTPPPQKLGLMRLTACDNTRRAARVLCV